MKQVTTNDPYDASAPFIAMIELAGQADTMSQHQPRWLVPGLEFFRARIDQRSQALWWDEGRTWTIYRGHEDTSMGYEILGHLPAPKANESTNLLLAP